MKNRQLLPEGSGLSWEAIVKLANPLSKGKNVLTDRVQD